MMAIGKSLRASRRRPLEDDGDDPRVGLVNLADVMLVFACGLMIALIAHFNMELGTSGQDAGAVELLDSQMQEVDGDVPVEGEGYSAVGTVYRDDETGALYVSVAEGDGAEARNEG